MEDREKIKRRSLRTDNLQIAKEKLRQFESAQVRGDELPLPTRIKIADILSLYTEHVRTVKTAKSAQTDIYYLRQVFGPVCPALQINSRNQQPYLYIISVHNIVLLDSPRFNSRMTKNDPITNSGQLGTYI